MKHIFARQMFNTNSDSGIKRYLSTKGFDVNREIKYEDGPTKKLVCAIQVPVKEVKKEKKVIRKNHKMKK